MATVAQNLQSILDTKAAIKGAIKNVTGETQSDVFATYPEKIEGMADISDSLTYFNIVNGKWVKPAEWDDIESMELDNEHDTIYLLYKLVDERFKYAYFMITHIAATTLKVSYGHVSDGVYTIHESCTELTYTSGTSHNIAYDFSELEDDYIVIRIQATYNTINRVSTVATGASTFPGTDLNNLPLNANPCLMRYGNMPRGTLLQFRSWILESDNIIDFAKNWWNTTTDITMTESYYGNYRMQRWRHTGWDIPKNKVKSLASMFYSCSSLFDTDGDFSGWCTTNVTSVSTMFYCCYYLKSIDVSNWNVTNVTTFASLFYCCYGLCKIKGLNTWENAVKCNNLSGMFYMTNRLIQDIDLSALAIGTGDVTNINLSSIFYWSGITSVNISGWKLGNSQNGMAFYYCFNLRNFIYDNNTVLPRYTSAASLFNTCKKIENISIRGADFKTLVTNPNGAFYQYFCYTCTNVKKIEFINCLFPTDVTINDNSSSYGYLFFYNYSLEYLDVRDMDFSVFTGTYAHLYAFRSCYRLADFYPPKNISKNLNITGDYSLTHESLQRIITNLVDLSGQTSQNIAMGAYNVAKLTQEDKDAMAAKNWTYSAS